MFAFRRTVQLVVLGVWVMLGWQGPAFAQAIEYRAGDIHFEPISYTGKPVGCSVFFAAAVREMGHPNDDPVVVKGRFEVRLFDDQLYLTGQLSLRRTSSPTDGPWIAPKQFFFASSTKTTEGRSKFVDGSPPGPLLSTAHVDDEVAALLKEVSQQGEFVVHFSREISGVEMHVPIKLNARLKRDQAGAIEGDTTTANFFRCVGQIANVAAKAHGR